MDFFDKIQDYINGSLSVEDRKAFEAELQTNEDLAEILENYSVIDQVLDYLIQEDVRKQLDKIPKPQPTYTLEELLEMFAVSEVYEDMVEATYRGQQKQAEVQLIVLQPKNKINCQTELKFELEMPVPFKLNLSILHQKENIVLEQEIAANTKYFVVNVSKLKPGRYYWHLAPADSEIEELQAICRIFFVRKDLEPTQLS